MVVAEADPGLRTTDQHNYFPVSEAIKRMQNDEPAELIYGDVPPITPDDLSTLKLWDAPGMKKPLVLTFVEAACQDIAERLLVQPLYEHTVRFPEQALEIVAFIDSMEHASQRVSIDTQKAVSAATQDADGIFAFVVGAMDRYLALDRGTLVGGVQGMIHDNLGSAKELLPKYYELLLEVFSREEGRLPTQEEFLALARSSAMILGRPASRAMKYLMLHKESTMKQNGYDGKSFDPSKFTYKARSGGIGRVMLLPEVHEMIEDMYREASTEADPEVLITGCPAAGRLMPAINERILQYLVPAA
ncbi:MAG: hypothetical protein HY430_01840 [Candidatus Levybacteria bacterium]|nr:hypothetical protein [Candidatus Levybacteria bacterium]